MPRDLDNFSSRNAQKRLDDKAAELEQQLQAMKVDCKRVYFVLIFIATVFFMLFVASSSPASATAIAIPAGLIFLIGTAKWLDFPWVSVNLQRWLDMLHKRRGKGAAEVEPKP